MAVIGFAHLEVMDVGVAVSVRDEEVAVGRVDAAVGRPVERLAGLLERALRHLPLLRLHLLLRREDLRRLAGPRDDHHQALAGAVALGDGVAGVVREPEVVLVVDGDGVRPHELRALVAARVGAVRVCRHNEHR